MTSSQRDSATPGPATTAIGALVSVAIFAIGMWSLHGAWFTSGYDSVMGDLGDARIAIAIMEHWFRVYSADPAVALLSPSYFYPVKGALGFTDSYFLFSLPYSLLRAFGYDLYASFMGSLLTFSIVGFWSFFALARQRLHASPIIAAIGAMLFAFPSMMIVKTPHCQVLCAMLLPAIILLVWSGLTAQRRAAAFANIGCAGALHGLIMFTAFQTGWFFTLAALTVSAIWAALSVRHAGIRQTVEAVWQQKTLILVYAGALAIFLIPFAIVYGPLILAGEKWSIDYHRGYAPRFFDIINTTSNNLVWGPLLAVTRISTSLNPALNSEVPVGYGFATFAAWFGFSIVLLHRVRTKPSSLSTSDLCWLAIGLTLIALWLIQLRWFGFWPWKFIYHLVPGGSAIRVTVRSQIVVNLGAALLVVVLLERLRHGSSWPVKALTAALIPLLVLEQFTAQHSTFSRREELAWIAALPRPPQKCSHFYISPSPKNPEQHWILAQSDAVIASQVTRLPTINGNSSRFPPGWNMLDTYKEGYAAAVRDWVARNNIADGICGLDPRTGVWREGLP